MVLTYFCACLALAVLEGNLPAVWLPCLLSGKGLVAETAGAAYARWVLFFLTGISFILNLTAPPFSSVSARLVGHLVV